MADYTTLYYRPGGIQAQAQPGLLSTGLRRPEMQEFAGTGELMTYAPSWSLTPQQALSGVFQTAPGRFEGGDSGYYVEPTYGQQTLTPLPYNIYNPGGALEPLYQEIISNPTGHKAQKLLGGLTAKTPGMSDLYNSGMFEANWLPQESYGSLLGQEGFDPTRGWFGGIDVSKPDWNMGNAQYLPHVDRSGGVLKSIASDILSSPQFQLFGLLAGGASLLGNAGLLGASGAGGAAAGSAAGGAAGSSGLASLPAAGTWAQTAAPTLGAAAGQWTAPAALSGIAGFSGSTVPLAASLSGAANAIPAWAPSQAGTVFNPDLPLMPSLAEAQTLAAEGLTAAEMQALGVSPFASTVGPLLPNITGPTPGMPRLPAGIGQLVNSLLGGQQPVLPGGGGNAGPQYVPSVTQLSMPGGLPWYQDFFSSPYVGGEALEARLRRLRGE